MFYAETPSQEIRQGDVFRGLITIGVVASKFLTSTVLDNEPDPCFQLNLSSNFATVVTPCCDIQKREYLAFCPLLPFPPKIRKNEILDKFPTKLNDMIEPENAIPKSQWDALPPEIKDKKAQGGRIYIYYNNFAFEKVDSIFEKDMIIDFNYIFNVSRKNLGGRNEKLLPYRVLQLSRDSRESLRRKIGAFYLRDPEKEGCFTTIY